jgi:hypothetical protein
MSGFLTISANGRFGSEADVIVVHTLGKGRMAALGGKRAFDQVRIGVAGRAVLQHFVSIGLC